MGTRYGLVVCCAAAAGLFTISGALAGAFAIRTQSAYGQGSSFAGIAAGGSLSSIFWNPANLADVQGTEIEAVGSGVFPDVHVKLDPGPQLGASDRDQGNIAQNAFVPAGYAAYRPHERLVLGLGINAPFGLTTEYHSSSILNQTGVAGKSEVFSLNLNPVASLEVTDWLALAVGAQVQYFDARLTRQALGPLGISKLEGDDVGFGFTAGIKVTPLPGTAIGLGYRSFIEHDLDGTLKTQNAGNFDVTYQDVNLPDLVTLGIRQEVTNRFRIMAGAEWSNWSRFDTIKIKDGPAPVDLQFNYDDGWFLSGGAEFDLTPQVSVRGGVGYEWGPIDDNVRTYRVPDSDRLHLSGGVSYRLDQRFSFDVGYSFVAVEDADIRAANAGGPDANGPFSGRADTHTHYVAAAIKVKF
jgi:long-chain fatty acid transport protein